VQSVITSAATGAARPTTSSAMASAKTMCRIGPPGAKGRTERFADTSTSLPRAAWPLRVPEPSAAKTAELEVGPRVRSGGRGLGGGSRGPCASSRYPIFSRQLPWFHVLEGGPQYQVIDDLQPAPEHEGRGEGHRGHDPAGDGGAHRLRHRAPERGRGGRRLAFVVLDHGHDVGLARGHVHL